MNQRNHANEAPPPFESVHPLPRSLQADMQVAAYRKRIRKATESEDWPADSLPEKGDPEGGEPEIIYTLPCAHPPWKRQAA